MRGSIRASAWPSRGRPPMMREMPLTPETVLEPSPWTLMQRRILGHWGFLLGAGVLGAILAIALLAPLIAPHDPYGQELSRRLMGPFWHVKHNPSFWLGTDGLGRDYLSRLIYGARISLLIGFAAMVISGVIGTTLGVMAGYFGG